MATITEYKIPKWGECYICAAMGKKSRILSAKPDWEAHKKDCWLYVEGKAIRDAGKKMKPLTLKGLDHNPL